MIEIIAKFIVMLFGVFLIGVGILMLTKPNEARRYIRMAGSTNFINYFEITVRMIPAAGLILCADISKYPLLFSVTGWFMIATSLVLYVVPRKYHHQYALWCGDLLKPFYIRSISPMSMLLGCFLIYAVV